MDFAKQGVAMPLVEAMLKYKNEDVYPMHTPGRSEEHTSELQSPS